MKLFDQRLRQALLSLELVVIAADDRLQCGRGPQQTLSVDIGRQAVLFGNLPHGKRDVPLANARCQEAFARRSFSSERLTRTPRVPIVPRNSSARSTTRPTFQGGIRDEAMGSSGLGHAL